jgi:hypothetical protein
LPPGPRSSCRGALQEELLDGLEPAEREQFEGFLTSIWEASGGYEEWAKVAEPEVKAA